MATSLLSHWACRCLCRKSDPVGYHEIQYAMQWCPKAHMVGQGASEQALAITFSTIMLTRRSYVTSTNRASCSGSGEAAPVESMPAHSSLAHSSAIITHIYNEPK